jgi:hypothetical protein
LFIRFINFIFGDIFRSNIIKSLFVFSSLILRYRSSTSKYEPFLITKLLAYSLCKIGFSSCGSIGVFTMNSSIFSLFSSNLLTSLSLFSLISSYAISFLLISIFNNLAPRFDSLSWSLTLSFSQFKFPRINWELSRFS